MYSYVRSITFDSCLLCIDIIGGLIGSFKIQLSIMIASLIFILYTTHVYAQATTYDYTQSPALLYAPIIGGIVILLIVLGVSMAIILSKRSKRRVLKNRLSAPVIQMSSFMKQPQTDLQRKLTILQELSTYPALKKGDTIYYSQAFESVMLSNESQNQSKTSKESVKKQKTLSAQCSQNRLSIVPQIQKLNDVTDAPEMSYEYMRVKGQNDATQVSPKSYTPLPQTMIEYPKLNVESLDMTEGVRINNF